MSEWKAVPTGVVIWGILTLMSHEFADRKFHYISFLSREILPLPRGVLDMFKEGKQSEDFLSKQISLYILSKYAI